jgi:hypothetical protein
VNLVLRDVEPSARGLEREEHELRARKRPDWSRPLPQALQILEGDTILTLATVGDVRELIEKRLPEESRRKAHGSMSPDWRLMPRTTATLRTCRSRCAWCCR